MNKFFLLMAFSLMVTATHAQDIKDIRNFTLLGQTQKAKDLIDKYLAVPKNAQKGEGWYYKGFIYNQTSKDSTKSLSESAELKATAFEAFKKYRELDPKAELLAEQNNSPLFDLYVGYYSELGVKSYVAKDPATAFEDFRRALEVHDYIHANNLIGNNGYKFSALDTFKLNRPNGSIFTKVIADRFSNIYVATTDDGFFKINPSSKLVLI